MPNLGAKSVTHSLILRGREFTTEDLELITRCVQEHFGRGRTHISQVVCEQLDWKQPNGWSKERACRDVLRRLEKMGLLTLPPPLITRKLSDSKPKTRNLLAEHQLDSPVTGLANKPTLEFAKGNEAEKTWNALIEQYHYLGHNITVGRCIKYLVKTEDRLLGALAFSSPAWRMNARDRLLSLLGIEETEVSDLVVNNSRFLILPNVRVPNLASTVLSLATVQVVADWKTYYSLTPRVAETFVQPSLYNGTCYKAANWIEIGLSRGYKKQGSTHFNSQEPKKILLYGLNRRTRRDLLRMATNVRNGL